MPMILAVTSSSMEPFGKAAKMGLSVRNPYGHGECFADAVKTAKELPELGVGVHLTVVDGTPILAPKQIPSLIDPKTGRFYADHGAFVKAYAKGKIRMSDVRHEWEAQIEKFLASGLIPTHVDSHQHMHVLPGLIDVALDLCCPLYDPCHANSFHPRGFASDDA